jgi:hypothetical protein
MPILPQFSSERQTEPETSPAFEPVLTFCHKRAFVWAKRLRSYLPQPRLQGNKPSSGDAARRNAARGAAGDFRIRTNSINRLRDTVLALNVATVEEPDIVGFIKKTVWQ